MAREPFRQRMTSLLRLLVSTLNKGILRDLERDRVEEEGEEGNAGRRRKGAKDRRTTTLRIRVIPPQQCVTGNPRGFIKAVVGDTTHVLCSSMEHPPILVYLLLERAFPRLSFCRTFAFIRLAESARNRIALASYIGLGILNKQFLLCLYR